MTLNNHSHPWSPPTQQWFIYDYLHFSPLFSIRGILKPCQVTWQYSPSSSAGISHHRVCYPRLTWLNLLTCSNICSSLTTLRTLTWRFSINYHLYILLTVYFSNCVCCRSWSKTVIGLDIFLVYYWVEHESPNYPGLNLQLNAIDALQPDLFSYCKGWGLNWESLPEDGARFSSGNI